MVQNVKTEAEAARRRACALSAGLLTCGLLGLAGPANALTLAPTTTWTPLPRSSTNTTAPATAGTNAATDAEGTAVDPSTTASTGNIGAVTPPLAGDPALDPELDPDANAQPLDFGRQNLRETTLDDPTALRARRDADAARDGVRLGTMVLRPSITEKLVHERNNSGGERTNRTFSETGLKGSLTSDWSRHELTIGGEGYWQKNLSGDGATDPRANINADLRLDLADDTVAHIKGGYAFSREDSDDPNAISGASVQSGIHQYTGGLSVEHDFGRLRGTIAADVTRAQYSDAELSDGTSLSLSDRDRWAGELRGRVGYEISPALTPFIEVAIGKITYDEKRDTSGYARSADTYAARAGVAVDFGDKLKGELGIGYERQRFEDSRLDDLAAVTVDGNVTWSPRQATDVDIGLSTTIDPSTTAGLNGSVIYALNSAVQHQLRSNLVLRLANAVEWTQYPGSASTEDSITYTTGAGLTWSINRYLELTTDVEYERKEQNGSSGSDVLTTSIGLTAKR
ncbi:MAG: outer membrane beta-barrel protein [Rhizobium sp.]|nr:outer membrane beta-barrel protein [Rhizobium sp.]